MPWTPRVSHLAAALVVLFLLAGCTRPEIEPVRQAPTVSPPYESPTQPAAPTSQPTAVYTEPFTLTAVPLVVSSPTPAVSEPEPDPDPVCLSASGTLETGSLPDERLRQPLEYSVYLPPCYDQDVERRYPVLYLIHGQSYNQDQWDRLGADDAASRLAAAGQVTPFIIVMPRDRLWGQPEEDGFGVVLVEKLLPFIDTTYCSLPARQYRAIGGLSRGAGWAVHLGLQHWGLFGSIGAHSLPVFWSDTRKIRSWLEEIPSEQMPRIYLDIGEKDRPQILRSARWFEELLTQKGIPHEWFLFPGYHEEAYWQAHVEQYLLWYAAEW